MQIYRFEGNKVAVEIGFDEVANGVFLAFAERADLRHCEPCFAWQDGKLYRVEHKPNKAVDSTTTRVTPPASSLRSGQESRHGQP